MREKILITGSAGFIGFHLSKKLLELGYEVIGVDNLNNYYSPLLKTKRNEILKKNENYHFFKIDFSNWNDLWIKLNKESFEMIIHLGAQAGVRYSLKNPWGYINSNILGTVNIYELAKRKNIEKIILASSSSVYGNTNKIPFKETDCCNNPISLYAASKKSDECIAYSYLHTANIKSIILRFFTVYGEWGRPDMAYWKFSHAILSGKKIELYNWLY